MDRDFMIAGAGSARNVPTGTAKAIGTTVFHPVGTLRMGTDDAPIDAALRMRGIGGLRVVDASVIPTIAAATPIPRPS